jgi:hypothetical protein
MSEEPAAPGQFDGWRWDDPRWREWTEGDPGKLLIEALRRAVDIRDRSAEQVALSGRPLLLVDVLNELRRALNVWGLDLRDGSDLWNAVRFGEDYDEAAFWKRQSGEE